MLNNSGIKSYKDWRRLVSEFKLKSISSAEFCQLHKVSKSSIYKWYKLLSEEQNHSKELGSFIPLDISHDKVSDLLGGDISLCSSLKISNGSGVTIELASGCKLFELTAIIEVLNAAK